MAAKAPKKPEKKKPKAPKGAKPENVLLPAAKQSTKDANRRPRNRGRS